MKKTLTLLIISVLLVLAMVFSLCACSTTENDGTENSDDKNEITLDTDNTTKPDTDTSGDGDTDNNNNNTGTTTPDNGNEPDDDTTTDTDKPSDDNANAEYAKKVSNFIYVPEYIYDEDIHAFHNELKNIVIFDESTAKYVFRVECKPETRIIEEVETFGYNITLVNENGTAIDSFFYIPNTYVVVRLDNYGIQKVMSQVDEWNLSSVIKTHQ
jgi:hypothetical protein